jgi:acyl-CoA synthetase (AMP-forming)/AMP-acid ligase II/acyl carrier protein
MSIPEILKAAVARTPDAIALLAPERNPLSYVALDSHVARTVDALRQNGVKPTDIVAVVLPNGPEMATAFLSVASGAVCAPLNPSYSADEFRFYLSDLPAAALVVARPVETPARDVARQLGIPIIEIEWTSDDPAGVFTVSGTTKDTTAVLSEMPLSADVALVLHTSGTTSRPKIVPLTHGNLAASAQNIATSLELTSSDRCLNVMPLFHIHGLVAALLSSLHSGGSVVCTPGFLAPSFLEWLGEFTPTWYTAVPTMHAAILARARVAERAVEHRLRFIRSCSSALAIPTFAELEKIFGVPVVEAYGMTEAAHQMTCNPLPPGERKPGTVGRPAGPEVVVFDSEGKILSAGMRGEVAIKGPNVTSGYARNPQANADAFTNGWLRTGDEGVFDDDGYLTLIGRRKEIINRGGEKISPREIDEILLAHPAVASAVTFAAPDNLLGEDVAAAVVLRDGRSVSERQIREFVSARVAYFKVPRKVVFLSALPMGPTGKLQRIGLADRLGISFDERRESKADYVAPNTPVEEIIADVWSDIMKSDPPGINDDFLDAGGDSTLAAQIIARVRDTLGVNVTLLSFFDSPTVAGLARVVEHEMAEETV